MASSALDSKAMTGTVRARSACERAGDGESPAPTRTPNITPEPPTETAAHPQLMRHGGPGYTEPAPE